MSKIGPTVPIQASAIKKGGFAVLKDRPCKITNMATSKTGKHGHAKIHFHGIDVFTDKKYEDICPSTHTMQEPVLTRTEYDLMDIDEDDYLSLIHADGNTKDDLMLPGSELGENIRKNFDDEKMVILTILSWGDVEESIISFKIGD